MGAKKLITYRQNVQYGVQYKYRLMSCTVSISLTILYRIDIYFVLKIVVTSDTKPRCSLLRPVPSYYVYCYAQYQVTMFIVTAGTKLRCLLLRPVPSYDVYCYGRYQALMLYS